MRTRRVDAPALSRDAVVTRALEIADADGLEAVTVRRLAQDFGVTPMALYWHFKNKEEVLDAMADELFAQLSVEGIRGPWHEQLREVFERLIAVLRAHPGAATLTLRRVMASPNGQLATEHVLRILADAGFSTRDAANLASQGLQMSVTLVANEPGTHPGVSGDDLQHLLTHKRAVIMALPEDRFAHVRAAADALLDCNDPDEFYAFSLDLFVAGAQAIRRKAARVG